MNERNTNEEIEIDLKELWTVVLSKFWMIAGVGIGLALMAFLYSRFIVVPQYESTTKVYILNKQNNAGAITYSDLQTGTQLTKDYMTLVTSRPVTELVIAELGLGLKHEKLVDMVSVSNPKDTRILDITVKYSDPFMAKQIADAIRDASAVHITEVMNIEKVSVVEEGNVPEEPSSPNTVKNTAIGGLIGLALAGALVIFLHIVDDTIKTPDDIEKYLGLSVLSSIPIQDGMNPKSKSVRKRAKAKERLQPDLNKL